ncbi:MAG: CPBP family intramembrane metalloprotease [Gammaproteobacteria bacterium]|nr:CPBP family intramembrane metalloprotease [Gammaproteobacteria bacterium]
MPTFVYFLLYLIAAGTLSALLYYPVFQALSMVWEIRPDRVFYRLVMILSVLGFWPFIKLLGMNNRAALGYSLAHGRYLRILAMGFGIGVVIMTVHACLLVVLGARFPNPGGIHFNALAVALFTGLLSGLLVAVIEETFFRGALQHGLRRQTSLILSFICVNLFFAAVHFTRPPIVTDATSLDWYSGWEMLAGMLHKYANFTNFADSFITLFVAGLLLSLIRERTGNIVLCIGIHAGWVLIIRIVREVTNAASDTPAAQLIGSYDNITGWAATLVLGFVTLVYWRYGRAGTRHMIH